MNNQDDQNLKTATDLADEALEEKDITAVVAKIKSDSTKDEVEESNEVAETLQYLQNIIERNANELDRINKEMREKRESLKSVFENDAPLQEVAQEVEVMTQQLKERKAAVKNSPQATSLQTQIGELSQEKKEIEETLSNHLVNYYSMTNSKSFDTSTGDQWEFSIKAKVKAKPQE